MKNIEESKTKGKILSYVTFLNSLDIMIEIFSEKCDFFTSIYFNKLVY